MADSSTLACLTVLGGSLSGTRFVLEEAVDNILIGSDPSCRFCLPVPGVSPIHARLWIDMTGATVYDANSPRGLYVNDDRVNGQLPLRNGDVLWLGTPGEEEVVMIQCRLPPRMGQEPAASEARPTFAAGGDERETMMLDRTAAPAVRPPRDPEPAPLDEAAAIPAEVLLGSEPVELTEDAPATLVRATADEQADEPLRFSTPLAPPSSPPPAHFEEDIEDPGPAAAPVDVERPVVLAEPAPPPAPAPPLPAPVPVLRAASPEPPPPPRPAPATPPPAARPAPAPPPEAPRAAPARERTPPASRPGTPPPARKPALDRTPVPAAPALAPPAGRPRKGGSRNAVIGVAAVVLLAAAAVGVMKLRSPRPTEVAAVTPTPPPVAPTTPPTLAVAPTPSAEAPTPEPPSAPPPVVEEVTIVKSPPPASSPVAPASRPPSPGASPVASPAGRAKPGSPTPSAAAPPSAESQRAQQIAGLLGQAEQALTSNRHETAAALYEDVLKLEPQNTAATSGRTRAQAALTLSRRSFVAGRTAVQTEKAGKSLSGFETEDVSLQKNPDFLGRIEFEVNPPRMAPGVAYSVKVFVVNEGRKPIKLRSLTVGTTVNGSRAEKPSAEGKEIAPQQRLLVGEVGGEWKEGTTSWALDAQVTANKGDSLRNVLNWK